MSAAVSSASRVRCMVHQYTVSHAPIIDPCVPYQRNRASAPAGSRRGFAGPPPKGSHLVPAPRNRAACCRFAADVDPWRGGRLPPARLLATRAPAPRKRVAADPGAYRYLAPAPCSAAAPAE